MPFYDPTRCPGCGTLLPPDPARCTACDLPLTGPRAVQLQNALRYADQLVAELRRPVPVPVPMTPYPAPAPRPVPERRGPRPGSVPAILLGLGALCLLVAATVFLAVAWGWLGVGGRTAVLLSLTAAACGASLWLGARGLRLAAEALGALALGLVLLDVAGVDRAGWLDASPTGYGVVLLVAGLALLLHPLRLVAAQVAAALGLAVAVVGLTDDLGSDLLVAVLAVLAFAVLVEAGRLLEVRVLPVLAAVGGGWSWAAVVVLGLERAFSDPTPAGLWLDGGAAGLLAATALLALPALHLRGAPVAVRASLAGAATLLTGTLALPAVDRSLTALLLAAVVALVAWSGAALVLPRRWLAVPAAPLAAAGLPLLLAVVLLAGAALGRVLRLGEPFTLGAGVRLDAGWDGPHPALLGGGAAALLLAAVAVAPLARRRTTAAYGALPLLVAVAATPALLATPLAAVLAAFLLLACAACLNGRPGSDRSSTVRALAGLVVAVGVLGAALPSAALTTLAAAVLTALASVLARRGTSTVRLVGHTLLPLALAATVGAAGEVGSIDPSSRSLLALALVGVLAVARPRVESEAAAVVAGILATALGSTGSTSLAVHLTLAGALVTTSALVHRDRRLLAWPGGLLLAAATWVRLGDIGVAVPEPYTLPTALALVGVGLHRLVRDRDATTATTLLPGLLLATVPSLAWALADPLSPRAVALGVACLALVLLGARSRWGAPLLVGAAAGTALVLREAAPYLAQTPQWVLIGTAGAVLTAVGITWERRLVELRRAGAYVTRLR